MTRSAEGDGPKPRSAARGSAARVYATNVVRQPVRLGGRGGSSARVVRRSIGPAVDSSAREHSFLDAMSGSLRVLMLPDANHMPARIGKATVRVLVTRNVCGELFSPELGIGERKCRVLGTGVPETTVHEDRNLLPRKDDVDAPSPVERDRLLQAEP